MTLLPIGLLPPASPARLGRVAPGQGESGLEQSVHLLQYRNTQSLDRLGTLFDHLLDHSRLIGPGQQVGTEHRREGGEITVRIALPSQRCQLRRDECLQRGTELGRCTIFCPLNRHAPPDTCDIVLSINSPCSSAFDR